VSSIAKSDPRPQAGLIAELAPATLADRAAMWASAGALVLMRSHVSGAALEADECNYLYVASRLMAGDRLYENVWDHQPPGVFWLFALLVRLFGDSPATLRWTATAAALVSLCFLFEAARRSLGRPAAWLTAAMFAIAYSNPLVAGEGGNREIYMNALAAAAMWVLLRGAAIGPGAVLWAGFLWGLASLLKTVAAAQWFGVLVFLCLASRADLHGGVTGPRGRRLALFAVGPAVIWTVTVLLYAVTGRFQEFVQAVFAFNLGYAAAPSSVWSRFVDFFDPRLILRSSWLIWLCGAGGLIAGLPVRGPRRRPFLAWSCYAVGSYAAVCLPGRFWPHYYLLCWQPLVVLAAAFVCELTGTVFGRITRGWSVLAAGVLLCGILVWEQLHRYLLVPPEQVGAVRYGQRMEWARRQGELVASVTRPSDTVYVWGIDAGIYYYAHRRCASRYTMNTALQPDYPNFQLRRQRLLQDLIRNRPILVVLVDPEFDELADLLLERYYLVGEDRDPSSPQKVRARFFQRKDRFDPERLLPWPRPAT